MDSTMEARVAQIEGMVADLHKAAPSGGGIAVVDVGTLLSTLDEAFAKVAGEDAWARVGRAVLHPQDGLIGFANRCLDARLKQAAGIATGASTPFSVDRHLKPTVDLLTHYVVGAGKLLKPQDVTTLVSSCATLLKRTANAKGLSALQDALFGPLHECMKLAEPLALPAAALAVEDLCELMVRLIMKTGAAGSSQRVKRCALHFVGVLCRMFPAETIKLAPGVLKTYKVVMQGLVASATPEFAVAAGLLDGLCEFFHYSMSPDREVEFVGTVYAFMCRGLELHDHTRYDVPRAALRMLHRHPHVFASYMVGDFNMLERLKALTSHRNNDVVKHAVAACHPYAATVALGLAADEGDDHADTRQKKRAMLKKFCEEGHALLARPTTHAMSLGAALIGTAAIAAGKYSAADSADYILQVLVGKFRSLFDIDEIPSRGAGGAEDSIEAVIRYMPSFLNPIATAVAAAGHLSGDAETAIADVLRCVWRHIGMPYIFASTRAKVGTAVARLLLAVYRSAQDGLSGVLNSIVIECITVSAVRPGPATQIDFDTSDAAPPDASTSWPHVNLWLAALNALPTSSRAELWEHPWDRLLGLTDVHYSHMGGIVFDALAGTMMNLIRALNLTPPPQTIEGVAPPPTGDMVMFADLSRFWHAVCAGLTDRSIFARWALPLLSAYAEVAAKHPHLPSIYQLLKGVVDASEDGGLLAAVQLTRGADGEVRLSDVAEGAGTVGHALAGGSAVGDTLPAGSMLHTVATQHTQGDDGRMQALRSSSTVQNLAGQGDATPPLSVPHAREFLMILFKLVDATLLRLPDMKDDLLVTCVTFLLSVPVRMVHLQKMAAPLSIALTTGLSYPPLAALAVEALDAWLNAAPHAVQDHLAPKAVGILQSFLCAAHLIAEDRDEDDERGGGKAVASRDTSERHFERRNMRVRDRSEWDELQEIQVHVIQVLGRLGAGRVADMISRDSTASLTDAGWDVQRRVVIRLPFGEIKQDIALDTVLPRVAHLALRSNDRKTKVAACEFLHSVLLWMVGTNAYSVRSRNNANPLDGAGAGGDAAATPFHALYRKLFPVVAELAVDPELIARQLFGRLLMQLIRWLTRNVQFESKETIALLDALLDGIASDTNSALRDVCATGCAEFVKYSLKHSSSTASKNLTSITTRLHNMLLHPSPWKRAGAALAFTRVLPHMYPHDAAVATHVLHIIYNAILMLALSDDGSHRQCLQNATTLLGKCEAIAVRKAKLLLRGGEYDKTRAGMPTPAHSLEDLADWLLDQCFYEERVARRWAMRLVLSLSCCIPRYSQHEDGPRLWMQAALEPQGGVGVIARVVESRITPLAVLADAQQPTPQALNAWTRELETCADAYLWLVSHELLDPRVLQAEAGPPSERSTSPSRSPKRRKTTTATDAQTGDDSPSDTASTLHQHCMYFFRMCAADALSTWVASNGEGTMSDVSDAVRAGVFPRRQAVLETLVPLVTTLCRHAPGTGAAFATREYLAVLVVLLLQPSWLGLDPHAVASQTRMPLLALRGIEAALAMDQAGVLCEQRANDTADPMRGGKRKRTQDAAGVSAGAGGSGGVREVIVDVAAHVYRTDGKNIFDERMFTGIMERRGSCVGGSAPQRAEPKGGREHAPDTLADTMFLIRGARGLLKAGVLTDVVEGVSPGLGNGGVLAASLAGGLAALPTGAIEEAENRRIIGELWKLAFELHPDDETVACLMGDPAPVSAHELSGGRLSKTMSLLTQEGSMGGTSGTGTRTGLRAGASSPARPGSGRRGEHFYTAHRAEITKHIHATPTLLRRLAEGNSAVSGTTGGVYFGRFAVPIRDAAAFAKASPPSDTRRAFVTAARDHLLPLMLTPWAEFLAEGKARATQGTTPNTHAPPGNGWRLRDAIDILFYLLHAEAVLLLGEPGSPDAEAPTSRAVIMTFFNAVVARPHILRMPPVDLRELCRTLQVVLPFLLRTRLEPPAVVALISNELPVHHFEVFGAGGEAEKEGGMSPLVAPYRTVVRTLCAALAEGRSSWFLDTMFPLFRGVGAHPMGDVLGPALTAFFESVDENVAKRCAEICVAKVIDHDLPPDVRCAATYRVGLLALQRLTPAVAETFFAAHAYQLYTILNGDWPQLRDAEGCYSAVLCRTAALALLEAMYRMCPPEATKTTINAAFAAALHNKPVGASQLSGKEMNDKFVRLAHAALTAQLFCEGVVVDVTLSGVSGRTVVLKYHEAAYGCLAAALIATQNNKDLITRALFVPRKGGVLWEHIIDTDARHAFDVETNFTFTRSAVQGLRNEWETDATQTSSFFAPTQSGTQAYASQAASQGAIAGGPASLVHSQQTTASTIATQPAHPSTPRARRSAGTTSIVPLSSLAQVLANPAAPIADMDDVMAVDGDEAPPAEPATAPPAAPGAPSGGRGWKEVFASAAGTTAPSGNGGPRAKPQHYSLQHDLVCIPLATQRHVKELLSQPEESVAGVAGDGDATRGSDGDKPATGVSGSGSSGKASDGVGGGATPACTPQQQQAGRATPAVTPGPTPQHAGGGDRGRAWFSTQEADVEYTPQLPMQDGNIDGDLEVDSINRSPIMPTLLRVLVFLKGLYGETATRDAPAWMTELLTVLSSGAALNIRIFVAKVVVNAPHLFAPFAADWVAPLVDLALETVAPEQLGVTYFMRDIVGTIVAWGEEVQGAGFDAETRVARLLEVLLKACTDSKKAIVQANLELVKALVAQWQGRVRIGAEHKRIILGWMAYPETESGYVRARVAGLQLLGVLLTHGVAVYDKAVDGGLVSESGFYDRVLANLPPHPQQKVIPKELIDTSAEVLGLIYQQQSVNRAPTPLLHDKVSRKLRALHGNAAVENFLLFLGGVMKHYPPIADEYLPSRILRFVPHARGPYQALILEIINKRVQLFPAAYTELHPFVPDLLLSGTSTVQLLVFEILGKALAAGTPRDVHHYVMTLSVDIKKKLMPLGTLSLDARSALYDSWVKVFDARWDELSEDGKRLLTGHLLGGLQDGSTYIRDRMLRFWDDPSRLPASLHKRLERLFVVSRSDLTLYSPSLGDQWLQYAAILLLFLTHRSHDFTDRTAIFRDPLAECEYKEMPVVTAHHAWGGSAFGMGTAASIAAPSLSQDGLGYGYGMGTPTGDRAAVPGGVLATPVASSIAPATPASLVATNFAHYEPRRAGDGASSLSQTSMLFQPFQQDRAMPPPPAPGAAGSPARARPGTIGSVTAHGGKLKRRFRRVTTEQKISISALHATQTVKDRVSRYHHRLRHAASQVKMWRVYREGEVPDIQISLSSILLPLEALCLYDVEVAQLLLTEVFQQSYAGLGSGAGGDVPNTLAGSVIDTNNNPQRTLAASGVREGLHDILGNLVAVSPTGAVDKGRLRELLGDSVGAMLGDMKTCGGVVTLLHGLMLGIDSVAEAVDPAVVYDSALASNNLRTGVLLLERGVILRTARTAELAKEVWKRGGRDTTAADASASLAAASDTTGSASATVSLDIPGRDTRDHRGVEQLKQQVVRLQRANHAAWRCIAFLSERLGDEDSAQVVVHDKLLAHRAPAAAAVGLAMTGDHDQAVTALDAALAEHSGLSEDEEGVLQRERRRCLAELGRWTDLSTACDTAVPFDPEAEGLWAIHNREVLKHHVLAKTRLAQDHDEYCAALHSFFIDAADEPEYAEALAAGGMLVPAAVVALMRGDNAAARGHVSKALSWTVRAWSGLVRPQRATQREVSDLLCNVQSLVEIDEYLKLSLRGEQGRAVPAEAKQLLRRWEGRVAAFDGSALQWEGLTHLRALLGGLLVRSVSKLEGDASTCGGAITAQDALHHHGTVILSAATVFHSDAQHAASRRFLHMFAAVQEQIEGLTAPDATQPATPQSARLHDLYLRFVSLAVRNSIARTAAAPTHERARRLFTKTIQYIEEEDQRHQLHSVRKTEYNLLCGAAYEGYAGTAAELGADAATVTDAGKKALVHLRDAATSGGNAAQQARSLEELAQFVDVLLSDTRYLHAGVDRSALSVLLVKSYLGALMTGASDTAQLRLPRALEVVQESYAAKEAFIALMKRVDSWFFLPWVNQIVSYVSTAGVGDVASLLLMKLAKKFPQQVFCALSASSQELQTLALKDPAAAQRLEALLRAVRARIRGDAPQAADAQRGAGSGAGAGLWMLTYDSSGGRAGAGRAGAPTRLERFVTALEKLHNPDLRFKSWMDELQGLLREYRLAVASAPKADPPAAAAQKRVFQTQLHILWHAMCADVFSCDARYKSGALDAKFAQKCNTREAGGFALTVATQPQAAQEAARPGVKPARRAAAAEGAPQATTRVSLYDDIEKVLKPVVRDISAALDGGVWDIVQKRIKEWQGVVKGGWAYARNHGPAPLSLYSTWLAEFQCTAEHEQGGSHETILMPQQPFGYLATKTPSRLPDVASIAPSTLVMNSIQKPKKVVFHGTDEREYPFLVKGGEDLRQDQRIQQMFQLFNSVMARRARCRQRRLEIRGYSVVPLSPRVGLVEWVPQCMPMKAMIEGQLVGIPGVQAHHAAKKHHEFLLSVGKTNDWAQGFKALYGDHGKVDLKTKFEELASEIDPFYLKKAMIVLCATHAQFYDARSRFTASYAAASVAQWMVGIGDRHLDNFLIDTRTCDVVPIDFGHAFGTATELLHIPELMPFRLTPQLQGVWAPLGASLLKGGMSAALAALQKDRQVILDVLSVFVREPLATWQRTALRRHRRGRKDVDADAAAKATPQDTYAATKINIVRQKLNLVNPWIPVAQDLAQNTIAAATTLKHSHGMAHARAIIRGRAGRNARADAPDTCRSTEEQVACLIDMASDPNILCRTYMGWAPLF